MQSSVGFENSYGVRINMMSRSFMHFDFPNNNTIDHTIMQYDNISHYDERDAFNNFKDYLPRKVELLIIPFILIIEISKASFATFVEHYFSENYYYPVYGLDEFHGCWLYPYPYDWNTPYDPL